MFKLWPTASIFLVFYSTCALNINKKPILIIISYDGFRNEYLQRNVTPNLLKFRNSGVYVDHMINVFPTKTFTNHHTIATGLYPDTHGVLANALYDKDKGELKYGYDLFHYDETLLPIWTVNEKYGNGHSGCMMWPGSNFNYSGISCTHTQAYDKDIPLKRRVDTMMRWLTDAENPANLIMFYSEQPDKLAHITGPDSRNVTDMVAEVDKLTMYIQEQLTARKLIENTNIIQLSDHGMAAVSPPNFIDISEYLEPNTVKFYGTSPVLQIVPVEADSNATENVYQRLLNGSKINGRFDVYRTEDLPKRWNASNKKRFGPIIAIAKMNYAFQDMWQYVNNTTSVAQYGVHGYDNKEPLMYPIFMAKGPSIKAGGQKVDAFDTVDLFPLFLYLLGLTDSSGVSRNDFLLRNGSFDRVSSVLIDFENRATSENANTLTAVIVVVIGLFLISSVIIFFVKYRKRKCYVPAVLE